MRGSLRLVIGALAIGALLPIPAQAYQQQLSSEQIREAYLLGSRNDEITVDFWNHYERIFASPSRYLHVGAVEVLTPYAQVVSAAQHHMTDENSVDAVQKFAGRTLPFIVRVTIYYPTDAIPGGYDIEKQSRLIVSQARPLKPQKTTWRSVYTPRTRSSTEDVVVEQQFDVNQVSSADLKIRVTFQDGPRFETTFDLSRLQ